MKTGLKIGLSAVALLVAGVAIISSANHLTKPKKTNTTTIQAR